MKFLAVSFSVLLVVLVCLAFIYPPKLDKRHYENAWYDGNNYSFYLKPNHQFSLWKYSNNKLNFVGAGNWKIHEGAITLGNVKNSRFKFVGNYKLLHTATVSFHHSLLVSTKEDFNFFVKRSS